MTKNPPVDGRRLGRLLPRPGVRVACRRRGPETGPDLAVSVLNIAPTGVLLAVTEDLGPGCEVVVRLHRLTGRPPVERIGNVAWSAPASDGTFWVGLAFQKRLPYEDCLELGREPSALA